MELTLQIWQGDFHIMHGHVRRVVAEQFHDGRKAYARTEHLGGIGVPEVMRDSTCEQANRMAGLMPVVTQLTDQRLFSSWSCQQQSVCRKGIERTKEAKAINKLADERVYRDHSFCLEFAQRNVDRPLIWAGGMETIKAQIGAFADSHAGMTDE